MTPSQVRGLETVAAAISPCLGCLQEDLAEAEAHADGPSSSLLELAARLRVAANAVRQQQGQDPVEGYSEEELEQERAYAKSVRDHALNAVHVLLTTVPIGQRRASCSSCTHRKRHRKELSALATRVAHNPRELQRWEADDEGEIF